MTINKEILGGYRRLLRPDTRSLYYYEEHHGRGDLDTFYQAIILGPKFHTSANARQMPRSGSSAQ